MRGYLHSIQTLGTVDGPGVRFVIFVQGCNQHCVYCHNPDTWNLPDGELTECEALVERAQRYRNYYGTHPGVTVTGGEALCQEAFVTELLQLFKERGWHTALDTSGYKPISKELLAVTDLCLLDVKFTTEEDYRVYSGTTLSAVMNNLQQLDAHCIPTWIRHVIVPGINDTEEDISRLNGLLSLYHNIEKVELLPFRKLCLEKYEQMSLPFALRDTEEASRELMEQLERLIHF